MKTATQSTQWRGSTPHLFGKILRLVVDPTAHAEPRQLEFKHRYLVCTRCLEVLRKKKLRVREAMDCLLGEFYREKIMKIAAIGKVRREDAASIEL